MPCSEHVVMHVGNAMLGYVLQHGKSRHLLTWCRWTQCRIRDKNVKNTVQDKRILVQDSLMCTNRKIEYLCDYTVEIPSANILGNSNFRKSFQTF